MRGVERGVILLQLKTLQMPFPLGHSPAQEAVSMPRVNGLILKSHFHKNLQQQVDTWLNQLADKTNSDKAQQEKVSSIITLSASRLISP